MLNSGDHLKVLAQAYHFCCLLCTNVKVVNVKNTKEGKLSRQQGNHRNLGGALPCNTKQAISLLRQVIYNN